MYTVILQIHIWTSILFMFVSVIFSFLLIRGLFINAVYSKTFVFLEDVFIILLYLGLFLGVALYFLMPANKYEIHSVQEINHILSLRFWSIEHFSVMLFAVILAQIGKVFTTKLKTSRSKYRYALLYYGMATLITLTSMVFYMLYKG